MVVFPGDDYLPSSSFRRVFEAVEVGRADYGLVAMENSQAGSINETYDLFLRHGLHLVGETILRVDHCLLGFPGTAIDELEVVTSHPQALAQCEEFVSSLDVEVRADYDTAGSAKRIIDDKLTTTASIASRRAGALYGLDILAEKIQTYPDNYTRFGVLSKQAKPLGGSADKTSIVFGVGHVPGSLYRVMGAFAERHLNLNKLESRPRSGRPWEYVLYADILAAADHPSMVEALAEVSEHATFTRVLGTYASAPRTPD